MANRLWVGWYFGSHSIRWYVCVALCCFALRYVTLLYDALDCIQPFITYLTRMVLRFLLHLMFNVLIRVAFVLKLYSTVLHSYGLMFHHFRNVEIARESSLVDREREH